MPGVKVVDQKLGGHANFVRSVHVEHEKAHASAKLRCSLHVDFPESWGSSANHLVCEDAMSISAAAHEAVCSVVFKDLTKAALMIGWRIASHAWASSQQSLVSQRSMMSQSYARARSNGPPIMAPDTSSNRGIPPKNSAQEQRDICQVQPQTDLQISNKWKSRRQSACCNPPRMDGQPRIWGYQATRRLTLLRYCAAGITSSERSKTGQTTNHCLNCMSGDSLVMMT